MSWRKSSHCSSIFGFHVKKNLSDAFQDKSGQFQALPYELAHGIAKTATKHCYDYQVARRDYYEKLEQDPTCSKAKTVKAKEDLEKLKAVDLYMVFNRRTGQMATREWMKTYLTTDEHGIPKPKKENSTAKPWIACLRFELGLDLHKVSLAFKITEGGEFREVRLFHFEDGMTTTKINVFTDGYKHLLHQDELEEDRNCFLKLNCVLYGNHMLWTS